ncbi:MAG: methyl-accepting chemotaxis protein [Deltaproteobacteria bacterium]|nr:methyl-accepting chemotaxis protein [Deltaproteobacteria bacterium]
MRKFLHRISIKSFLIGVVGVLVLLLTIMSVNNVWNAYRNGKEYSRVGMANDMADAILTAAGFEARERGMTAMALASDKAGDSSFIEKVHETRAQGEESLKKANELADKLVEADGSNTALKSALLRAKEAYARVESARREADRNLSLDSKNYLAREWIKVLTNFIQANAEVRLAAFASTGSKESLQEALRMNIELKQSIWLVSEYAGRERATMANFISSRRPLDTAASESLKTYRAIVDINLKPILRLKDMNGIDPEAIKSVAKMEEVFIGRFGDTRTAVYAASATGDYPLSGKEWIDRSSEGIDTIVAASNAVGAMVYDGIKADVAASRRNMAASVVVLAVVIAIGLGSILVINSKVITPMVYLNKAINEIENTGDLTLSINVESRDESGQMAKAFNGMMGKFHGVIRDIHSSIERLASSSEELSASAVQIAGGTKSQSAKATQVSTAAQEMNATILEVARNVSSASDAAKDASGVAIRGGGIVARTIDSMNGISVSAKESSGIISALGDRSKEIGNIINVIDDIADQTNLLALNAAIEAARAGEQGRGFAVVADEVRKLAEKTMQATKEIGSMIKSMQDETARAITSVEREVVAVEDGVGLAMEAGEALKEIVTKVDIVTSMIHQVSTATEEQSAATEQISNDIESVAGVVSETSSSAEQIARTSQDIAELAGSLKTMVQTFKISGSTRAHAERHAFTDDGSKVVPMRKSAF